MPGRMVLPAVLTALTACAPVLPHADAESVVWSLGDGARVAGHATEVVGTPKVVASGILVRRGGIFDFGTTVEHLSYAVAGTGNRLDAHEHHPGGNQRCG